QDTLDTNFHLLLSHDLEVAESYGKGGSVWMIRPRPDAKILDFSDGSDLDRVASAFADDFESDSLPGSIKSDILSSFDEESLPREKIEQIARDEFAPEDIVDTARAFDNTEW